MISHTFYLSLTRRAGETIWNMGDFTGYFLLFRGSSMGPASEIIKDAEIFISMSILQQHIFQFIIMAIENEQVGCIIVADILKSTKVKHIWFINCQLCCMSVVIPWLSEKSTRNHQHTFINGCSSLWLQCSLHRNWEHHRNSWIYQMC